MMQKVQKINMTYKKKRVFPFGFLTKKNYCLVYGD